MGAEIISFADRKKVEDGRPRRKHKHEPEGFFPVPRRIMHPLKRFEESLNRYIDHGVIGEGFDWRAVYEVMTLLELSFEAGY